MALLQGDVDTLEVEIDKVINLMIDGEQMLAEIKERKRTIEDFLDAKKDIAMLEAELEEFEDAIGKPREGE